jgi:hypothetical protein
MAFGGEGIAMRLDVVRATVFALLGLVVATVASANHHTDCTMSGGTNGPGQLNCTLPDFVAPAGSQEVLKSSFVYTPSTDFNPATCAVGTLSVNPVGQFLSIDTTVLDASSPKNFQEVEVSVDPSGLAPGTYDGSVRISLTTGPIAPQCPGASTQSGTVSVRLVITQPAAAPALNAAGTLILALVLGVAGLFSVRRSRRQHPTRSG